MKENIKDLFFLCVSACGITFMHIWASIFSYYATFCYHTDNSVSMSTIYSAFFFVTIG